MTAYTVTPGTQVHHDGETYPAGATLEATDHEAALWLRAGIVELASEKPSSRGKRPDPVPVAEVTA